MYLTTESHISNTENLNQAVCTNPEIKKIKFPICNKNQKQIECCKIGFSNRKLNFINTKCLSDDRIQFCDSPRKFYYENHEKLIQVGLQQNVKWARKWKNGRLEETSPKSKLPIKQLSIKGKKQKRQSTPYKW